MRQHGKETVTVRTKTKVIEGNRWTIPGGYEEFTVRGKPVDAKHMRAIVDGENARVVVKDALGSRNARFENMTGGVHAGQQL